MSEHPPIPPAVSESAPNARAGWEAGLEVAVCVHCHWRYLVSPGAVRDICPNCYQGNLSLLPDGLAELAGAYTPELIVPYSLSKTALAQAVHDFAAGIPFTPEGLNETALRASLTPIYLPVWLVDGQITARWQADAGFNYEVVSHTEAYDGNANRWQTREIKEPRVRWENRVGQLNRSYQNVTAPAIDDAARIEKTLGGFNLDQARSYDPECLTADGRPALVRLPDHPPKESWSETAAAFQKAAAAEVQQACGANALRQFRWNAQYARLNWTLLLLPLFSASYQDDQGNPQPVHIHGQTGKIFGARKASMRRARRTSLMLLLAGIALFLLGLGLDALSPASSMTAVFSTYASILGIAGVIGAAVPLLITWDFNHRQALEGAETKP